MDKILENTNFTAPELHCRTSALSPINDIYLKNLSLGDGARGKLYDSHSFGPLNPLSL